MYKRVLVPLDGSPVSEQALPFAQQIARPLVAKIELLRVISPPDSELLDQDTGIYLDQISAGLLSRAEDYLREKADSIREKGFTVATTTLEGEAAETIVNEAMKVPETLIAMASRGRSGVARMVLGSVADKVLRSTNDPLLMINSRTVEAPDSEPDWSDLIVPLDGSPLAEQVLPHAISLAKTLDLRITLLRAIPTSAEYSLYSDYPMPNFDDLVQDLEKSTNEYLEKIGMQVTQLGVDEVKTHLVHGNPAEAICDFVQNTPNSAVAMTTHGRSGLGRWVMGSVTDRVVRYAEAPVLVLHAFNPDD